MRGMQVEGTVGTHRCAAWRYGYVVDEKRKSSLWRQKVKWTDQAGYALSLQGEGVDGLAAPTYSPKEDGNQAKPDENRSERGE